MSQEIRTQFSQVFIHYFSNKSRSTTKLFISDPGRQNEEILGRLFGIIEINTPSRDNSRVISQIISDLEDIYYSSDRQLPVEQLFESALKTVNNNFIGSLKQTTSSLVGN